ncbi:MAG: heavy-metal-associated domain-containing protein [Arcicella sp.]|jgi:copper chaperone CopZ|nr:heavy-metal-associated domain-containing protein [Arcicella sp.]
MKTSKFIVENLKCNGCVNTIRNRLNALNGILSVAVDRDNSSIEVIHNNNISQKEIKILLANLGYPEENSDNSIILKAKSYVSCAIGRMSN